MALRSPSQTKIQDKKCSFSWKFVPRPGPYVYLYHEKPISQKNKSLLFIRTAILVNRPVLPVESDAFDNLGHICGEFIVDSHKAKVINIGECYSLTV